MNYNQYNTEVQGPSKLVVGGIACATAVVVAAATFALTSPATAMYTAPAATRTTNVAPMAQFAQSRAAISAAAAAEAEFAPVAVPMQFQAAAAGNKTLLFASFSSMMLAVASALAAAFGYRTQAVAMASGAGVRSAAKGGAAKGGQAGLYKGSTVAGSAPSTRDGKPGYVYKLGLKNGRGNVDEYSPIYNPGEWKSDGDVYEPGFTGIALWAAGFLALLGASAFLIYTTSQL